VTTVLAFMGAGAAGVGVLWLAEATTRRWGLAPESARKLAHVGSGMVAAGLPFVLPFGAVAALAAAFIPFMVVSRRLGFFPSLHGVERSSLGEIYFPLGVLAAAAVVPLRSAYVFGVLVMGISDAVASLVGQRFGRRTFRAFSATKTYLGSAAFLATTIVLALAFLDGVTVSTRGVLVVATIGAAMTAEEGLLGGGADNAFLPVSAAALLRLFS
jgi:phytol kinase